MNLFSWISEIDATLLAGGLFFLGCLLLAVFSVFTRRLSASFHTPPPDVLRQNKEWLQPLVDRMPIACITWNADFTVGLWNPEAEKIFGYSEQDAVGRHAFDLIIPEGAQTLLLPVWEKLMSGAESTHSENENITRDGALIICDWYNTPLKNDQSETIGLLSMVRDVTKKRRADQSTRHAAELQQIILNAIPAPIFFKDAVGFYLGCNEAFAKYIGLKPEQIVGHTAFDIAPADKAIIYEKADKRLLQAGGIQIYEAKVRYADGSDHDVVFHKAVYQNTDGTVGGIVGNMLDVSDIRKAEAALTEVEQSYREVFNASSEAIILRDVQTGRIVDVNRSMLEMYGCSYEEALKSTFTDLSDGTPPYGAEQARQKVQQGVKGEPQLFEWRAKRKDGTRFWTEVALSRSTISGEERTLAVVRDITERKEVDQARKESEERFQMLIEHAADSLVLHDEKGCILNVNQRACETLGYDRLELIGMTIDQFDDRLPPEALQEYWRQMPIGKSSSIITEHVKKDGERFPVEVNIVKFESIGAEFYLALARDITERKAAETELALYRGKLEELVRERTRQLEEAQHELVDRERLAVLGQLTATVSHELRNPLGTVKNAIYLLGRIKGEGNEKKIEQTLALADRNISRCDSIINELLDFTRQQEGTTEEIDLGLWVQTILDDQTLPDDIELKTDLPTSWFVSVNPERFRRAFINVFTNAVQSFERYDVKRKRLSIILSSANQRVELIVTDNGAGISDEVMLRIFEPMFSTKSFGVGLGMAIVKNIMEEQGGGVELKSEPGAGTTVRLWLPLPTESSVEQSGNHWENGYEI